MAIDVSTFNFYFKKFYSQLCFLAIGFVKSKQEAEDIVQDTYLSLFLRMDRTEIHTVKSFLFVTVMNKCRNVCRHAKVIHGYEKDVKYVLDERTGGDVLNRMVHSEFIALVMREVNLLPPVRQKVFKMAWIDEMKNGEIAEELNISKYTVKEHKCYALKQIRTAFANLKIPDNA